MVVRVREYGFVARNDPLGPSAHPLYESNPSLNVLFPESPGLGGRLDRS